MKWTQESVKSVVSKALALVLLLFLTGAAPAPGPRTQVGRDIFIPEGTASSEAVAFGASVRVEGTVERSAVAIGGDVYVSGSVGKDAVAIGGTVVLAPGAVVHGNAVAIGGSVQRAESARVDGDTTSISIPGLDRLRRLSWPPDFYRWQRFAVPFGPWFWLWGRQLTGLLSSLALGIIILVLLPNNVEHMVAVLPNNWGRFALIGFLGYLVAVPLMVLMAITIVGIPLAMLLGLALAAARFLAHTTVSLFVGQRLLEQLIPHKVSPFVELVVGLLGLFLVRFVPLVGWLVGWVAALVGLGVVLDTRFGSGRSWLPPRGSN